MGSRLTPLVLAAIAIGLVGRSVELTLPLVLSSAQGHFGLSNVELGLFAMAEVLGVTVASASSFLWAGRLSSFTLALAGLTAFAAGNIATPFVPAEWLVVLRFVTACFGEGLLLVVATSTLGMAHGASRVYSIYMAVQMLAGAALLSTQGYLASGYGLLGVMLSLTVLSLATLATLPVFAADPGPGAESPRPSAHGLTPRALAILGGMGVYHIGVGGAWAFLQQRGAQHGLDFTSGGWALGAIMASGLVGNLAAVALGARLGVLRPLLAGTAGLGVGGALAGLAPSLVPFVLGGIVLMIGWNLAVPYQIALLASREPSRAQFGLVPAFQGAGLAAGPMVVGLTARADDYTAIATLSVTAAAVAAVLFARGAAARSAGT